MTYQVCHICIHFILHVIIFQAWTQNIQQISEFSKNLKSINKYSLLNDKNNTLKVFGPWT